MAKWISDDGQWMVSTIHTVDQGDQLIIQWWGGERWVLRDRVRTPRSDKKTLTEFIRKALAKHGIEQRNLAELPDDNDPAWLDDAMRVSYS